MEEEVELSPSRHSDALRKIGEVADSHRDTAREVGQTSGRVEELQVRHPPHKPCTEHTTTKLNKFQ